MLEKYGRGFIPTESKGNAVCERLTTPVRLTEGLNFYDSSTKNGHIVSPWELPSRTEHTVETEKSYYER